MNYSLKKINTVEACNAVLAVAQKKKRHLERRRRNLGESIDNFSKRMDKITTDFAVVQLLLNAFVTAYHTLPDGSKYKVNLNIRIKRLELRKARLDKKAFTYNVPSLLAKQVKYNRLDSQVSAINHCIAALQNKRTALHHTTLRVIHTEKKLLKSQSSDHGKFQPKTGRLPLTANGISFVRKKLRTQKMKTAYLKSPFMRTWMPGKPVKSLAGAFTGMSKVTPYYFV